MFSSFEVNSLKIYQLSPVVRPFIEKIFGKTLVEKLAAWIGWDLVIKGSKNKCN